MEGLPSVAKSALEFFGLVSAFSVIDIVLPKHYREKVAEYVFGFHNASFSSFELGLLQGYISAFFRNGEIRFTRLLIWSFGTSAIACLFIHSFYFQTFLDLARNEGNWFAALIYANAVEFFRSSWGIFLVLGALSLTFFNDLLSLKITYRIFFGRSYPPSILALPFLLDLVASNLLVIAAFVVLPDLASGFFHSLGSEITFEGFVLVGLLMSMAISAVFHSLLLLFLLVFGTLLRAFLMITKLNRPLVLVSDLHKYPCTFIGLVLMSGLLALAQF